MKLRNFVGKARQRILHTLFGRNLYAADERVKKLELSVAALEQHWHYENVCKRLRAKIDKGKKLTVAFTVIYDASFVAKPLFKKMLNDDIFDPYIVIIPDILRGKENMRLQYMKSYTTFSTLYGNNRVLDGYNVKTDVYTDCISDFDLVFFTNPYEAMTYKYFTLNYLKDKDLLPIYISYGGEVSSQQNNTMLASPEMSLFWKIFVNDYASLERHQEHQIIKGKNVIVSGNIRMDEYANITTIEQNRKKIIIAPHHTIGNEYKNIFQLSNFLFYADFFLELPKKYPEIDFVFRPHPLLFVRLRQNDMWGKEKADKYIQHLLTNTNVIYSDGGDFIKLFAQSSAIIHDCGSFIYDYLFTGKPCCYMLKNKETLKQLNTLAVKSINCYYIAENSNDILSFIENVVIAGYDYKKNARIEFADKNLKINFPDAADYVIKELKQEFAVEGCYDK